MLKTCATYSFYVICFISFAFANNDNIETMPSPARYDGYSVFRIIPSTAKEMKFIQSLREDMELDFWIDSGMINRRVDIMIPPGKIRKLKTDLKNLNMKFSVIIQNVQSLIDKERKNLNHHLNKRTIKFPWRESFFHTYHQSEGIYEYLEKLEKLYPSLMTIENIGTTYLRRTLKLVKIGIKSELTKPIIWIDGGIHAREWISPATATYFIHKLLKGYRSNADVTLLLAIYDFYVMPVVNPDGYDFTHDPKGNRLWRKNLSKSRTHHAGVDLNRNFKYGWNNSLTWAVGRNQYSELYIGPFAMSEEETQAIARVLLPVKNRVKLFLSLHSYSQYILFPWGCKREDIEDYRELKEIGMRAASAIKVPFGTRYVAESTYKKLYPATGSSIDWAYGELGIKYSFCLELRDKGREGFHLGEEKIIPVGEETWRGVLSIVNDITVDKK